MNNHPLHALGFEAMAAPPALTPRSFGDLVAVPVHAATQFASSTVAIAAPQAGPVKQAQPTIVKGAVVKGSRVRLADGSAARVVYVDPNMRIARVRTEDGRNVTVRRKDLR